MKTAFMICLSWIVASRILAGDAVAIGYNSKGIWTSVTYYNSSTPKGGRDYKDKEQAREEALRDLRKRGGESLVKTSILADSDLTGHVAVARGKNMAGEDVTVVGYGKSEAEAEKKAFEDLKHRGATGKKEIVYHYFSYGSDAPPKP